MHGTLRLTLTAALTALALPAFAGTIHSEGVEDRGAELTHDPYTSNSQLTTGRISGFRSLYGEAAAIADGLKPAVAPAAPPPVEKKDAPAPDAGGEEGEPTETPVEKPAPPPPPAPARGDLPVKNPFSAWADVVIGDVKVGVIGPYGDGAIHDVKSGGYDLSFTLPNGYTTARHVETVAK